MAWDPKSAWRWLTGTRQGIYVLCFIGFAIAVTVAAKLKSKGSAWYNVGVYEAMSGERVGSKREVDYLDYGGQGKRSGSNNHVDPIVVGTKEQQKPKPPAPVTPQPVEMPQPLEPKPMPPGRKAVIGMSIFDQGESPEDQYTYVSDRFAPYGRLLRCELAFTVDSLGSAPVIGLVTEALDHDFVEVLQPGIEVHGTSAGSGSGGARLKNRVQVAGEWVIVWRTRDEDNGKELRVNGVALCEARVPGSNEYYDIVDGSFGIRGRVIDNTDMKQLMQLAALFIAGVGQGMTETTTTVTGSTSQITSGGRWQDAVGMGLNQAAQQYAQRMLEQIQANGSYVLCAAGTEFYLYVKQVMDIEKAVIAGTNIPVKDKKTVDGRLTGPGYEYGGARMEGGERPMSGSQNSSQQGWGGVGMQPKTQSTGGGTAPIQTLPIGGKL